MANINWQNLPSETTPINSTNLNVMSAGLLNVSTEVDNTYRVNLISSKNMLKLPNIAETTTTTGLTYSISNGVLTINGTASANTTIELSSDLSINIPDKTGYRISVNKSGTTTATGSNLQFLLRNVSTSTTILGYVNNIASASQTSNSFQSEGLINNAIFVITSGVQLTNAQFTFQVEEGTSATSYEPFTQRKIVVDNEKYSDTLNVGNVVDSRSRVNVLKSNNLFDSSKKISNYNITSSGTMEAGNGYNVYIVPIKPSTQYVMSIGSARQWVYGFYTNYPTTSSTTINNARIVHSATNETFTSPSTANYMCFREVMSDYSGGGGNEIITNLMINEGNTRLPYEPYIQNQIVVDNDKYTDTLNVGTSLDSRSRVNVLKGKNLIDKNSVEVGNGIITNEGIFSANTTNKCILTYIEVEANKTYTLNYNGLYRVVFYNSSKATISANAGVSSPYTFTTPANTKYIRISGDLNINLDTMRLEEGSSIITPSIYVDNEEIYSKPVVLWTNSNTTSSFAGQQITLSSGNYDYIEVYARSNSASSNLTLIPLTKIIKGCSGKLITKSGNSIAERDITYSNDTTYTFSDCYVGSTQTNTQIIPYMIIGGKF